MSNYSKVANEIETINSMKDLLEGYEEMAVSKMKAIRNNIEYSREYYYGLSTLAEEVGADVDIMSKHSRKKEAAVFLSADDNLYGDIFDKIFATFITYVQNNNVDAFIVGKTGEKMFASFAPTIGYKMLPKIETQNTGDNLKDIRTNLIDYHKVKIFYGEFNSIVKQEPRMKYIFGDNNVEHNIELENPELYYIYEPTLNNISKKFGEEIFMGIWEHTTQESNLAQQASRLMYLDKVLGNIDIKVESLNKKRNKVKKHIEDRKQNSRVKSIYLKKKRNKNA